MSLYLGNDLISGNKPINLGVRNIGEIFPALLPVTDAGAHLLDGSLILGGGIYQGFVDYIANIVSIYPDVFTTESAWQSSVSTYGSCGKFVYNATDNTVRLPKVSDILQGTTDLTALGDLIASGLPQHTHTRGSMDITGTVRAGQNATADFGSALTTSGAFYKTSIGNNNLIQRTDGSYTSYRLDFKASNNWTGSTSNANYTSTTATTSKVQPQTIKVLYYIVIANSTKTEIEVDIDEVVTDLNGKADVDLTNCTKPHITETYVSSDGLSWYRIYSDGWCEQGVTLQLAANANNTVTLLKAYKDMTYQVLMRQNYIETGNMVVLQAQKLTEQTIKANLKHAVNDTYYSRYCSFYAYGYIS